MLTRTSTAMLQDLLDPANEVAWADFDRRYRPILVGLGRRLGLGPEDAADAAQETLRRFVQAYRDGRYDRERGRLRSWLIGIARNCVADLQRRDAARRETPGHSALDRLPGQEQLDRLWDAECERAVLRQALASLQHETKTEDRTLLAFELVAFHERRPSDVAAELGMTANEVYLAKHRCLRRLRGIVGELTAAYALDD